MSNSRKNERKREREAAWAEEQRLAAIERNRKEELSMYDRIDESDASADVKDILHRMAIACGLSEY